MFLFRKYRAFLGYKFRSITRLFILILGSLTKPSVSHPTGYAPLMVRWVEIIYPPPKSLGASTKTQSGGGGVSEWRAASKLLS